MQAVNANSGLTQSDWDSLKLNDLGDTVSGLDYNHPIRNFVEQRLLSPVNKLAGSEKRIIETHTIHSQIPLR